MDQAQINELISDTPVRSGLVVNGKDIGEIHLTKPIFDDLIYLAQTALHGDAIHSDKNKYIVNLEADIERLERTLRHITCDTKNINDKIAETLEEDTNE